ncbi:arsenate reductase/protein-tyrosine-phosphatase family protein [Geodermatophilus sp. SYSU D00766]
MRILFVCTGNICRSPMGERLTRAFLDDALGASAAAVGTSSAGTHAVVGKGMEPSSALVLAGLGGDPSGFSAQQLTGEMIESADLVLTMTRRHRREVLKLAPRVMFRAYTLREAGDLLQRVDVSALPPVSRLDERARALVAALGAQRATRRRADRDADDVRDPIGQRPSVHQEVGEQVFASLIPLLQALCDTRAGVRAGTPAPVPAPRADAPLPTAGPATARIDLAVGAPPAARRRPPLSRRR